MNPSSPSPGLTALGNGAIVGAGRLGTALAAALPSLAGPFGRRFDAAPFDVVLLAVPDAEIAGAAEAIAPRDGLLVGHCSGATPLSVLAPHEAFGLHPLMTVTGPDTRFAGAHAAVAGSTPRALAAAQLLAEALGLHATAIDDADRPAYHAAASIAANFLVTLEDAAERLLATTGADRAMLVPLVRAAVENWARDGRAALTGPIARGDAETVAVQRDAVATRTPELLELFDALADATAALVPEAVAR